jgi:hypothetical protein
MWNFYKGQKLCDNCEDFNVPLIQFPTRLSYCAQPPDLPRCVTSYNKKRSGNEEDASYCQAEEQWLEELNRRDLPEKMSSFLSPWVRQGGAEPCCGWGGPRLLLTLPTAASEWLLPVRASGRPGLRKVTDRSLMLPMDTRERGVSKMNLARVSVVNFCSCVRFRKIRSRSL